jgi:hypothetical protein
MRFIAMASVLVRLGESEPRLMAAVAEALGIDSIGSTSSMSIASRSLSNSRMSRREVGGWWFTASEKALYSS